MCFLIKDSVVGALAVVDGSPHCHSHLSDSTSLLLGHGSLHAKT